MKDSTTTTRMAAPQWGTIVELVMPHTPHDGADSAGRSATVIGHVKNHIGPFIKPIVRHAPKQNHPHHSIEQLEGPLKMKTIAGVRWA